MTYLLGPQTTVPTQQSNKKLEYITANKPKPQLAQLVVQQTHSPQIRITTATDNASTNTDKSVVAANFEKMIAFYQVFFSSQTKNRLSEVIDITPSPISDDIKECMESSLTIGELTKEISIILQAFVKKCSQERNYISKYMDMPFLTNTSLTYMTSHR